jgi:hypothetical protein
MAPILNESLDAYSRFAVPLILAAFPDWERHATIQPDDDGLGGVGFCVPCPNPNVESGLYVSTCGDELTVGFDMHHEHYTDYENPCNPAVIADGIECARACLKDRRVAVSWGDENRWWGSSSTEAPGGGCIGQWSLTATRFRFRSWTGRHDRDVTV